jgi:ribonuclease HII
MKTHQKGAIELDFHNRGLLIAGCDEVGRGCLAGPVYAAAVILDYSKLQLLDTQYKNLIRDSKTLSQKQRQAVIPVLQELMLKSSVASTSVREIEESGIVRATFQAMKSAFLNLGTSVDKLLIDGNQTNPLIETDQLAIIGGDGSTFAIAAASILAKEARDAYMRQEAVKYPEYRFEDNVGYGTKSHLEALQEHGITPLHRRNFAPVRHLVEMHHSLRI